MSRESLQLKELTGRDHATSLEVDVDAEHRPDVSRRASNAALQREAVQMRAAAQNHDPEQVQAIADRGVQGSGQQLPHLDAIQRSFGHHDVSGVTAHVGGAAAEASEAMGAEAFATGDHVAFGGAPDLHTAAHEAAHVVQQRAGVHLKGGVGAAGDQYESHADAVADRVVQGKSAEDLLGPASKSAAAPSGAVQRKDKKEAADPKEQHEQSDIASNHALMSQLKLLAKHMYLAGPALDSAMAGPHNTPAGTGPAVQEVEAIFASIKREAEHCGALMTTLGLAGWLKKVAVEDVKLVLGAFTRFWVPMRRAENWIKREANAKLDVNDIKLILDGYNAKLGLDASITLDPKIENDYKVTDDKALHSEAVRNHLDAALEAVESVEAGNGGDANRLKLHVEELGFLAEGHVGAFKAHKPAIAKLVAALKALEKSHPDLKASLEASIKKLKALK